MYKLILYYIFASLLTSQPLFSQNNNFYMNLNTSLNSKKTLGFYNNIRNQNKNNINLNLGYSKRKLSSQLSFNFDDHERLNYDNSFINYKTGIANFNVGKINRIWSFSEKSSLVLSSNSRPLETISIKLKDNFNTNWLPSSAIWSIEIINAITKKSYSNNSSILSGARILLSPSKKLEFEIFQLSQWGGNNKKLTPSKLYAITFGNSNEGNNADINKLAGFGISYSVPLHENNFRLYGQVAGEDEAGNLPSCYGYISGIELSIPKIKYPTITTIELVDTRVPRSTNGNCGPNTMYNNGIYKYINYTSVLGAPIDSEAISLEVFGKTEINNNLSINYSTKRHKINDKDYLQNRLSSKRSSGTITSVGVLWKNKTLSISGNIGYQNLILDKVSISKGAIYSLASTISF